jgi:hypothetical protein
MSSYLASDYSSEEDEEDVEDQDRAVSEPPKKRGKKSAVHSHMFNVMKRQSKKKPVVSLRSACTELLNYLESLGQESKCKRIIGSGPLSCNCLSILKDNPTFMEAIGGFLLKWLDKPKVDQDQHLLTSYLYAEAAKRSVRKVPKGTFFYQVPIEGCACNDKEANLTSLRNHRICYHAFARLHSVARKR